MATANPAAEAKRNIDLAQKVNEFTKSKAQWAKTLMKHNIVSKTGGWNMANLKTSAKAGGIAPIAMGLASTRTGYHLLVGVGEIALYASQYAMVETIHTVSRTVGQIGSLTGTVVGWFSKKAGQSIKDATINLTCKITDVAIKIDAGATKVTETTASLAHNETTVTFVTRSAATLSILTMINWLAKGKIATWITKIPRVGALIAKPLAGGTPGLVALGVIVVAGLMFTLGTKLVANEPLVTEVTVEDVIADAQAAAAEAREAAEDATKAAELNTESVVALAEINGFKNTKGKQKA